MRRILIFLLLFLPSVSQAQSALYDEMCDPLQAVFCDYVRGSSAVNYISNSTGQYIGTTINHRIYGWGFYLASEGWQSFGQFRNGKLMFGLTMLDGMVKIGSEVKYVVYSLETGEICRRHTAEGDVPLEYPYISTKKTRSPYRFKKEKYGNGDVFFGEFYNGKRHGYGVYCWANGDMWYGQYKNGYRDGYGMLIKPDRHVYYGKWVGDSKVDE